MDENSHYEFAVNYYNNYEEKVNPNTIKEMILEALEVEKLFAIDMLGEGVPGMTVPRMHQYLEYVSDTILADYGLEPVFNQSQPFDFMNQILLDTRSNFFERRSGSYTKLNDTNLKIDEDF